jgi:DNA repair exonuclease SbcCD ATPase subunit
LIRHLQLKRWRAYEHLDLELDSGTTFVVARNGIGKSSLIEAARFAATGVADHPQYVIRAGFDTAEAEVTLELDDSTTVVVRRSLRLVGKKPEVTTSASLNGKEYQGDIDAVLTRHWSAPASFVAWTAFLPEDLQRPKPLGVRDQLGRAFGVTGLREALAELDDVVSRVESQVTDDNKSVRLANVDQTAKRDLLASLAGQMQRAQQERDRLAAAVDEAQHNEHQAQQAAVAAQRFQAWQADATAVLDEISQQLGRESDSLSDAEQRLQELQRELQLRLDEVTERRAELRGRLQAVTETAAELGEADGICPVCLRELDAVTHRSATQAHEAQVAELQREIDAIDATSDRQRLAEVRKAEERLRELGPEPPLLPSPTVGDTGSVGELREDWQAAVLAAAALEVRYRSLAEEIGSFDADIDGVQELRTRYRELALLTAARSAVDITIDRTVHERVSPILDAVRRRWKHLFPDRPDLQLDVDGNFSRQLAGISLPFEAFSAGERSAAQLMLRLVLVDVATRVGSCWIDEPLEHLDPNSRRLIAGMLARSTNPESNGTSPAALRQILVTTYEEPLARRLEQAFQGTRIVHVSPTSAEWAQPDVPG